MQMRHMGQTKRDRGFSGIGGAMLLTALSCVCIAAFAMLAMSTAASHDGSSRACASEMVGYYEACARADTEIARIREDGEAGVHELSYPISDAQRLEVTVETVADGSFRILKWQSVPEGDWEEYDIIEVIH